MRCVNATTHTISTVIGADQFYSGDGGQAGDAVLYGPQSVWEDSVGNVYIADTDNYRIRMINTKNNIITTIVGNHILP